MSIFSKKQSKKKETEDQKILKEEKKSKEEKKETEKQPLKSGGSQIVSNKNILLIKQPKVTEKSQLIQTFRQYVFNVVRQANKNEVKKAIEQIYHVNVKKVRMINIPAKKRRSGRSVGIKSGYKKAIVTLKEGQQIEIMSQK